jgi:hypothetical protein
MTSETPWSFREKINASLLDIEYKGMTETCQGGPRVGQLYINGAEVCAGKLFGGPLLLDGDDVYVPLFERKLFSTGFRLFYLNTATRAFWAGPDRFPMIWLDRIDGDDLYYATGGGSLDKRATRINGAEGLKAAARIR